MSVGSTLRIGLEVKQRAKMVVEECSCLVRSFAISMLHKQ